MSEPKHLTIARKYLGTAEIVGPKHSPVIMGWIKRLGARVLGITVTDDETAWCGTFMAQVMTEAGFAPPKIAVRAKSWATWGDNCVPVPGAVGVKSRTGGGHVFLIVGKTTDGRYYKALGGNQGNRVSIADVLVSETEAVRWPSGLRFDRAPLPVMPRGTITSEA